MATTYDFELDGYSFPRSDIPAHGPVQVVTQTRWVKQPVIGLGSDGAVMTAVGTDLQEWTFTSRASTATKNKLVAVYEGRSPVTFKTPQDTGGYDVLMTRLEVVHDTPIEDGKWLCTFTLVRTGSPA